MTWTKLDEGFIDHPKVLAVGPLAAYLHVSALVYCNRQLTDGVIAKAVVGRLVDWSGVTEAGAVVDVWRLVDRLVDAGLWEANAQAGAQANGAARAVANAYVIHDFLVYQPSREEALAKRRVRSEAGRLGGQRSAEARKARSGAPAQANAQARAAANAQAVADALLEANVNPDPFRSSHQLYDHSREDDRNGDGVTKARELAEMVRPPETADWFAERPEADRVALTNVAKRLGWTRPTKRAQLDVVWTAGTKVLDRRALEDVLVRCGEARADGISSPTYLVNAIRAAAVEVGASVPEGWPS